MPTMNTTPARYVSEVSCKGRTQPRPLSRDANLSTCPRIICMYVHVSFVCLSTCHPSSIIRRSTQGAACDRGIDVGACYARSDIGCGVVSGGCRV